MSTWLTSLYSDMSTWLTSLYTLKFWKLIHVIPTILKRSCLVLSYFEQDIKKCISSSISPELHCWHILDSGGVPLYIDLIQYGDDVMIFKICCKAPYQEDIRFSYNFLDCVYASFNKGKECPKFLIKSSHISEHIHVVKHVKWYGQKHMS